MSERAVTAPPLTLDAGSITDVANVVVEQTIEMAETALPVSRRAGAVSGFASWSLIASLAPYASAGASVAGFDHSQAAGAYAAIEAWVAGHPEITAALGLWVMPRVSLRPGVEASRLTGEPASDQEVLDRWARDATGGLIGTVPLTITPAVDAVAAHVSACETSWHAEFESRGSMSIDRGPWAESRIPVMGRTQPAGDVGVLSDSSGDERLVVCGVRGQTLDVWLACGDDDLLYVVRAALDVATDRRSPKAVFDLPDGDHGPLRISTQPSPDPRDHAVLTCPPFDVTSTTDITEMVGQLGPLTGISALPLVLSQAGAATRARFHRTGFEATSVAAASFEVLAAQPPEPVGEERVAMVTIDRPFAFAAVERSTRLCLCAGWVGDPAELGE